MEKAERRKKVSVKRNPFRFLGKSRPKRDRDTSPAQVRRRFSAVLSRWGKSLAERIRNLPLRSSFVLYVVVFLIIALAVSSATVDRASTLRQEIYSRYAVEEEKQILYNGEETYAMTYISPVNVEELFTPSERIQYSFYDAIVILAVPFWFSVCIFSAALLFYRNKLRRPSGC